MDEEIDDPDCFCCQRVSQEYDALELVATNMATLIKRLSAALRKVSPKSDLPDKALDYLRREHLLGDVLRARERGSKDEL